MRRIQLGQTGIDASGIGFGCASLGSRVSAADGLRALAAAFEQGVDWLDLAPAYGRGQAETIAAEFIRGRRDRLRICTKVGLAPPGSTRGVTGSLAGALAPLARRLVGLAPGLRSAARRSGMQTNRSLPLTAELLRDSLEQSLQRLGTDYVDLYALHNAKADVIARDDILRTLEDILASGKARAAGVASDMNAAEAAIALGASFSVVQITMPEPGASDRIIAQAEAAGMGVIVHSVFGVDGALARLEARIGSDAEALAQVRAATGMDGSRSTAADLLLARAFALNPRGVVLASMYSERSLTANLALADVPPQDLLRAAELFAG